MKYTERAGLDTTALRKAYNVMLVVPKDANDMMQFGRLQGYDVSTLHTFQLHKDKDKDKEALFNVAYNVTDNISSRAILRHYNIFNRYLPAFNFQAQPLLCERQQGSC